MDRNDPLAQYEKRFGSSAAGPSTDSVSVPLGIDEASVAQFLVAKKYLLTALELHQELLEGNNGIHNVGLLNRFFTDPKNYAAIVQDTEKKALQNKSNCKSCRSPFRRGPPADAAFGNAMTSIESPFAVGGLQPLVAQKDQQIALLEYKLRCTRADMEQLQATLDSEEHKGADKPSKHAYQDAATIQMSDEEGVPITENERFTLNALVRRYLLARGYKMAAIALAEEVEDQDLGPNAADASLLSLPGATRTASGHPAILSLLSMHRKRIAPMQQAAAETAARNDEETEKLREEIRSLHEQLELAASELTSAKGRVSALEQELLNARTLRGGAGANVAAQSNGPTTGGHRQPPAAAPPPAAAASAQAATQPGMSTATISVQNAPHLLRVVSEGLPALSKSIVTRHRVAIVPMLAAAVLTEGMLEKRRALLNTMLTAIRRPRNAERQVIKCQLGIVAGKLGIERTEQEVMPEVMALSVNGKTKERKALAALLLGTLAAFVSEKQCSGLLASLMTLSGSTHAVVRVGVVEGLTQLAGTMSDRWSKALQTGTVVGANTALEVFSMQQFITAEDLMWKCLLSNPGDNDAEDLAAAAANEFSLQISPVLALFGTKEATEAMVKKTPLGIPASWGVIPPSVAAAVASSLMPLMVFWSYRLGILWNRFLPEILSMLARTLQQDRASGPSQAVRYSTEDQRKVQLILAVLAAGRQRVRQCVYDEGYTITPTQELIQADLNAAKQLQQQQPQAPAGEQQQQLLPQGEKAEALAGRPIEYGYELFDFSSKENVATFPSETPVARQQRSEIIVSCLLKGTAATRRRETGQSAGNWKPVKDDLVAVSWPALKYVVRTLVPSLVRQAGSVNRSSAIGKAIIDSYAELINVYCIAFGPLFTGYVVRPMFMRAFGIPLEKEQAIPPPAASAATSTPSKSQAAAPASSTPTSAQPAPSSTPLGEPLSTTGTPQQQAQPPLQQQPNTAYTGRQTSLTLFSQILFGPPPSTPNYKSAGDRGSDWPTAMPELQWMGRSARDGKSYMSGGVWNAEILLPLFGSGLLACPAMPHDMLQHALFQLMALVAMKKNEWDTAQSLLEDCFMRASGGNSKTGSPVTAATTFSEQQSTASAASQLITGTASKDIESHASNVLTFILNDVLAKKASIHANANIRASAAGLYRSLTPLLRPDQLKDYFLPAISRLSSDADKAVVMSAVRALATIFSSPAGADDHVQELANQEITRLLAAGPKDVILEILRAFNRAIPNVSPSVRDSFILDKLLEMNHRVCEAAEAGQAAMQDMAGELGNADVTSAEDLHSAARHAVEAVRKAAMQAKEPWKDAKVDELEEVSIAVGECFRAFGACNLNDEVKDLIREAVDRLLGNNLTDPVYRDGMATAFDSLFPRHEEEIQPPETHEHEFDPFAGHNDYNSSFDRGVAGATQAVSQLANKFLNLARSGVASTSGLSVPTPLSTASSRPVGREQSQHFPPDIHAADKLRRNSGLRLDPEGSHSMSLASFAGHATTSAGTADAHALTHGTSAAASSRPVQGHDMQPTTHPSFAMHAFTDSEGHAVTPALPPESVLQEKGGGVAGRFVNWGKHLTKAGGTSKK